MTRRKLHYRYIDNEKTLTECYAELNEFYGNEVDNYEVTPDLVHYKEPTHHYPSELSSCLSLLEEIDKELKVAGKY
jgi:hypothetical protein